MKIFYRLSYYLSSNPNPLGTDKHLILKTCLDSFRAAGATNITFILDTIPIEWDDLFTPEDTLVSVNGSGNVGTFYEQLAQVKQLHPEEKVFLVEDDYLWETDAIKHIERALDELEIVSPYDHPAHYTEERFRIEPKMMRLIDNRTYRSAPSNTLTFATRASVIQENYENFSSYGVADDVIFRKVGVAVWCPVPSLATHLVTGLLAPNKNWL